MNPKFYSMTLQSHVRRKFLILLIPLFCVATASTQTGGSLRERIARRFRSSASPGKQELLYGKDSLQRLDFWKPAEPVSPLVIYVHGGGWKRGDKSLGADIKARHYLRRGYAFASLGYRLVPTCEVEDQAQDIASATAYLIQNAETLGFDGSRVVLMGHSAGAHLAALVGTDLTYLDKAGLGPNALRGIILLDGAGYDVPRQIAEGGKFMRETYVQAFGTDPERQRDLSPTFHAAAPNAPSFLILHVQRADGTTQSKALGEALRKAGTPAVVRQIDGYGLRGHAEINRRMGDPAYPATTVVDEWLRSRFAK